LTHFKAFNGLLGPNNWYIFLFSSRIVWQLFPKFCTDVSEGICTKLFVRASQGLSKNM